MQSDPITTAAVIAAVVCAVGVTPAAAQAPDLATAVKARVTAESLDTFAREITRYERPSGSPGENAVIDFIVERLEAAGVPVTVYEFSGYTSDPVSATVSVPGSDFAPPAITMAFSGATAGTEATAVDLGELDDLPELEVGTGEMLSVRDGERYAHVRGKIAVVTGQPRNVPTLVLEQLGAVAAVFVNPEERLNDLIVTSTWGTPSLLSASRLPDLPTAQIRRSDGDRLREMMRDGPVTLRVRTVVDTGWKPLRLPVARIMPEGVDDAPYVLFGGHIDAWYHGATDEGASNAAMLDLAIAFHANRDRMRRGLVVAWWPGHSNGRYAGSTWFADRFFDDLRTRGVAYLNIDGVGQTGAKRFSASTSEALRGLALRVIRDGVGEDARHGRPGRNSDQAFNGIGLPLLQINHTRLAEDGGYWWWHTPDDTYDKIDAHVLDTDAGLYADAIAALVAEPLPPLDIRAEAEALVAALRVREAESGGALDLSEARERAASLAEIFATARTRLAAARPSPELDLALVRVLRPMHRIMFVPDSDHHPDPGIYGAPLPGLEPARILAEEPPDSDRYGFALAQLVRERNRILEALDEATRFAVDALDALPQERPRPGDVVVRPRP